MAKTKTQQFHASNRSAHISEALDARVKDPLWFLARQWQTGEFEAESGGKPAQMEVQSRDWLFTNVTRDGDTTSQSFSRADPLEATVEVETDAGDSPAWQAEALEYDFGVTANIHKLHVDGYDGRQLDWYNFDYQGTARGKKTPIKTRRITPTQMYFRGAPHPRWWRLEQHEDYFESAQDPEPNALSLLLPEFFFVDIDNWYLLPITMQAGSVHEIVRVKMVDSFGVVTDIDAATGDDQGDDFALFALDGATDKDENLGGKHLLVPNIAADILNNDIVEEVRFIRDEQANLVWAWEHQIQGENGETVTTDHEPVGGPENVDDDGLPRFVLKSPTARSWIPYLPRHTGKSATNGEIHLRRGRTDENATGLVKQYRSKIVDESKRIFEEEVPRSGLRVRRIKRSAIGSDGKVHIWTGREVEAGQRTGRPNLRFDYLQD